MTRVLPRWCTCGRTGAPAAFPSKSLDCSSKSQEPLLLALHGFLPLLCAKIPFNLFTDKFIPPFAVLGFLWQLSQQGNRVFLKRKSRFPYNFYCGALRSLLGKLNLILTACTMERQGEAVCVSCGVWSKICSNFPKSFSRLSSTKAE